MKLTKEAKVLIDNWFDNKTPEELDYIFSKYSPDKPLIIDGVTERFSIGQPVKWEGMKFWVAEDNGQEKVLVCNCEDTKNIQQLEYNDWWVGRDCLNAL